MTNIGRDDDMSKTRHKRPYNKGSVSGLVEAGKFVDLALSELLMVMSWMLRVWVAYRGYNDDDDMLEALAHLIELHVTYYRQKGE